MTIKSIVFMEFFPGFRTDHLPGLASAMTKVAAHAGNDFFNYGSDTQNFF